MTRASLAVELKIIQILEQAGHTERLVPGLKKPHASRMFDALEVTYDKKDIGYYDKKPLKLYPNAKQLACWDLTIDMLLLLALDQRRLVWARSCRFSWVKLGKRFGMHRTTVKKRYLECIFLIRRLASKSLIDKITKI